MELLETSFSLERINVEGRRWGCSYMNNVDQTNPQLYISVSRDDVRLLNEKYMADTTLVSNFIPFDYDATSEIKFWNDYDSPESLPDPPLY